LKKLYYTIWSDAIYQSQVNSYSRDIWKTGSLMVLSTYNAFNLMSLTLIFKIHLNTEFLNISDSEKNGLLGFFIVYYFPPLLLNYFLVFYNRKWEKIQKENKHHNGKVLFWYFFISFVLFFGFFLIAFLAQQYLGIKIY